MDNEIEKIYYSLKETMAQTGLPSSTLRYWESQFSQLNPRKDGHGNRYYTLANIELIQRIKYIRDDLKITRIDAIKRELSGDTQKSDLRHRATAILERVRNELIEIRAQI